MYVNAFQEGDDVVIIERIEGERFIRREPLDFTFYIKDPMLNYGDHKSIYDEKLQKVVPENKKQLYHFKNKYPNENQYESDVNYVFRYLSNNYNEDDVPDLKVCFFDIEVGFTPENRYSNSDKAENEIISVSLTDKETRETNFLVLPPSTLTYQETVDIVESVTDKGEVFSTEPDLIKRMLDIIEPFDLITGWNSEEYDIKYIINRIHRILQPEIANRLCLCDQKPIFKSTWNKKFKKYVDTYSLVGRIHLDYMNLYKKYTQNELSSYKLDNIAYIELDERKIEYSGTLDDLYKKDFEKFVEYNIKDTELILRLDEKLKFIDTTNIRAHQNGVLINTAMGTVGIVDQAIINESHRYYEKVVPNKKEKKDDDETGAAGAFVVNPKSGLREMVSGNDIKSLYPSTLRSLNMSPETIVGHLLTHRTDEYIKSQINSGKAETFAEAWQPLFSTFEYSDVMEQKDIELDFEINATKEVVKIPAKDVYTMVFGSDDYVLSANGTIFTRKKLGIIPHLLERWYNDRKKMQGKKEEWKSKLKELTDENEIKEAKYWIGYWDQRQFAKKIDLNSLYGALLNKYFRFYDKRLGQSTTLTGRSITRHMASKINEIVTGSYDHTGKSIIYGDSVSSDSIINTNFGKMTVEDAFALGNKFWNEPNTNKEYSLRNEMQVETYDPDSENNYYGDINYIYRHKTNKSRWKLTDKEGKSVIVTGDHSIMVERAGKLCKIKPSDLEVGDILITM